MMIFFLCPDIAHPSGGTRRLYRYVHHLNRLGFQSAIAHQKRNFLLDWHGLEVPVVWMEDRPVLDEQDILVFPEGASQLMKQTRHLPNKRVVLALSWSYIYRNMQEGEDWRDYGIAHVLTPSVYIKRFLEWTMGINVVLIPDYIDISVFFYSPVKKRCKISYMTRKSALGDILRRIFRKKGQILANYEWTPLEDLTESEYASNLQESSIYLATSSAEGRNVSVMEAMASGCIVVGFSGFGGRDYMVDTGETQNCVMVEEGNWFELALQLEKVALNLECNPQFYDSIVSRAVETAARFGKRENEEQALKLFFESLDKNSIRL